MPWLSAPFLWRTKDPKTPAVIPKTTHKELNLSNIYWCCSLIGFLGFYGCKFLLCRALHQYVLPGSPLLKSLDLDKDQRLSELYALGTCWAPKKKCPVFFRWGFPSLGVDRVRNSWVRECREAHPCGWITMEQGWFAGSPLLLCRVYQPGPVSCVLSAFPTSCCCTSSTSQTLSAKNIGCSKPE